MLEIFPQQKQEDDDMDLFRRTRKQLLLERRNLRPELEDGMDEESFKEHCAALDLLSGLLKEGRMKWLKQRKQQIEEAMLEAYQKNDHSEMHKQRIRYQGNGRGPKKRYYYSPKSHWDVVKWTEELGKHPHDGGLAAEPFDVDK